MGVVMDIIYLRNLRVDTVIGVYDWEREIRQTVAIDLALGFDIRRAAASDDIADTLDYKAVSKRVTQFVSESEFFLVERLAEEIAAILLREFLLPWVRVRIDKCGALSQVEQVGVEIERGTR